MKNAYRRTATSFMQVVVLILAGYGVSPGAGHAAESAPVVTSHTRASLVSDVDSVSGPLSVPGVVPAGQHSAPQPDTVLHVGLRLQLQPGWHTYWRNPGDAGEPAHIHVTVEGAWRGEGEQIDWPVPERISEAGLMAYAYQGDVLLPLHVPLYGAGAGQEAGPVARSGRLHVSARADWLVCADVCVPESGHFELDLPIGPGGPIGQEAALKRESAEAVLFHRAEAAMPQPSPFAARLTPSGLLQLSGAGLSPDAVRQGWFLPLEGGVIAQNLPQAFTVQPGQVALQLQPDPYLHPPFWQKPLAGVLVLVDGMGNHSALQLVAQPVASLAKSGPHDAGNGGEKAREADKTTGKRQGDEAAKDDGQGVWGNLLSAFLGGMILNLMPCVFPVLAMKLLSLAHMGGAGWRMRWRSAVFYSVGVMGCFAALGGVMMALRYGGAAVGWGFQFQSTGFVVGVGWLLFILALNLLGVFQITGGRLVGRAGQAISGHGPGHDLLAGLLAVIVATPCTAPFMGVAIAAALAGPYWAGLLIFLAMGLGLAAPYGLLALMPGLARHIPRPGLWMERLKQCLAFPLLASCVWLLWVAVLQGGGDAVLLMAGGAVLLGFAGWLYGLAQQRAMAGEAPRRVLLGRLLAGLCLLACLAGLGQLVMKDTEIGDGAGIGAGAGVSAGTSAGGRAASSAPLRSGGRASGDPVMKGHAPGGHAPGGYADQGGGEVSLVEPFSAERLAQLRAAGRPVLVDMTASWCVTCIVNEHVALDVPSVQQAFRQHGVTLLRGDWTRRDARITAFLKAYGRDGVPLYVYYPPHGEGKMLPQILTPALVRDVLAHP